MERSIQIHPVGVEYVCDSCQQGTMQQDGKMLTSNPPQFGHKCDKCGAERTFIEKYPCVRFEPVSTLCQNGTASTAKVSEVSGETEARN